MTQQFLTGYKVLDLSQYIPGPYATRLLADLGADVLKIEPPFGDPMRHFMLASDSDPSALYKHLNRGKRIVKLNLKSDEGKEQLTALLKEADVLLESFRPGVMDRLGFGREQLEAINPGLVHCALSGFGQTGPYRDQAGHDLTYCAASGALSASGTIDKPTMTFPPLADHAGAMQAVNAIQAGLLGRVNSGKGAFIDVSLFEAALSWQYLGLSTVKDEMGGERGRQLINGGAACYNIYKTADDEFIALAPLEEKFWQLFCNAVERPDWIARQQEPMPQTKLINELIKLFEDKPLAHWEQVLGNVDCCYEAIPTLGAVHKHPQIKARGLLHDWEPSYPAWINGEPCPLGQEIEEIDAATTVAWR